MVENKVGDELCVAAWTLAGSKVVELRATGFEGNAHDLHLLLRFATAANSVEAIELLVAAGAEVNATGFDWDPHGGPLHAAAEWNSAAAAAKLIAAGAHVNRSYGSAWLETPLGVARRHNSSEVAALLRAAGAEDAEMAALLGADEAEWGP
jgi:ankyrin repeat protein